jgi:hypothetical protein
VTFRSLAALALVASTVDVASPRGQTPAGPQAMYARHHVDPMAVLVAHDAEETRRLRLPGAGSDL